MKFNKKRFILFFISFSIFFLISEIIIQLVMKIQIPYLKDIVEAMIIATVFSLIFYPIKSGF